MADKPKRPMSAYFLWLNSAREGIKKDNPGIKVTEIAKKGGELWRAMKDKTEWENKAVKAKDAYTKAIAEYERNGGGKEASAGKKKASGRGAKKPVKPADSDDEEDESD